MHRYIIAAIESLKDEVRADNVFTERIGCKYYI